MLKTLQEIFDQNTIETNAQGERIKLHSNTTKKQGLFIQEMFDLVKPSRSLEVGLAYGISTLFILEKHRTNNSESGAHIVIEPFPWGDTAMYNIKKEGLEDLIQIRNELSDVVIPSLYLAKHSIQFAYVDTTKLFDIVFTDFYFIDKILEAGGIIVIDDCDTNGINKVARFISKLPNYRIVGKFAKFEKGRYYDFAEVIFKTFIKLVPFKNKVMPNFSLKTSKQLELNYRCIAFQKQSALEKEWNWDAKL